MGAPDKAKTFNLTPFFRDTEPCESCSKQFVPDADNVRQTKWTTLYVCDRCIERGFDHWWLGGPEYEDPE